MRKYVLATLLLILFVCWMGPAQQLLSRYLLQEEPTFHEIQDGEWLSRIALRYYGDVSYWRELELINRAPDGDHIFPGEEIIIPSFDVLREIRKTQRLSKVNLLIHEQQTILAGRTRERAPERARLESEIAEDIKADVIESFEAPAPVLDASGPAVEPAVSSDDKLSEQVTGDDAELPLSVTAFDDDLMQENSTLNAAFLGGVALLIAILVIGVVVYLRRQKREEITVYGDTEEQDEQGSIGPALFLDADSSENDEDDAPADDDQVRNGATRERELA